MADTLSLCAFLPHNFWIKVLFHGKPALFDKLYDNRQTGDRALVLDICVIPGVDADDLRRGMLIYALTLNIIICIIMYRHLDNGS